MAEPERPAISTAASSGPSSEVLVQEPVTRDAPLHALEGLPVGQLAVDEEVGDLQEGRGLGQLLDREIGRAHV